MKRLIMLFIVTALSVPLMAGCGAGRAVSDATAMLDEYFAAFSSKDIPKAVSLFHEDLVDELGGGDYLKVRLLSRRALLGEEERYSVAGTSFEVSGNASRVEFEIRTGYELGEVIDETYTFTSTDKDMSITGIDLGQEMVTDSIAKEFFSAYGDARAMAALFIPALQSEQFTADLQNQIQVISSAAGEFKSYTFVSRAYDYQPLKDWNANFVYESLYTLHFSGGDLSCNVQLAEQNGVVGIYNASFKFADS